ncbi:MAG: hypothetical protein U0X73_04690 [Thermoanaerobaculia bacterium]
MGPTGGGLRRGSGEGGYALLLVIVVIFLVSTMLLLLAHAISIAQRDLRDEERRVETAALLDAILAETLAGFEASPGFAGVPEHSLGRGEISSQTVASLLARHEVEFVVKRLGYEGSWRGVIDTSDPTLPHLIALAPIQLLGGP